MYIDGVPPVFQWPFQFCAFITAATWILSLLTSNVSQVDRLWTFLPTIYTAYFALLPLWPSHQPFVLCPYTPKELGWALANDLSPRAVLILALVVTWMCRLSYNTYRRGLFSLKDEDYRWAVLRQQLHPFIFQVVNLTFIAATQNVLLLLLGIPARVAATYEQHSSLAISDYILAVAALVVLGLEFTADNQQFSFQTYKHAYLAKTNSSDQHKVEPYDEDKQWPGARLSWTPEDAKRGFVTRGLWAYSRHPNFACEQTFWWLITLMPIISASYPFPRYLSLQTVISDPGSLRSFSQLLTHITPGISLSILFYSSTLYTEAITRKKYTESYKAYQERVGMFGVFRTWEKGMALAWKGRKQDVEAKIWGKGKKE